MREATLEISRLLPMHELHDSTLSMLHHKFNPQLVAPLIVVPFKRNFILSDGHHRSAYLHYRGMRYVRAFILEQDADIAKCTDGYLGEHRAMNIANFKQYYVKWFRPSLEKKGIHRVSDYPVEKLIRNYAEGQIYLGSPRAKLSPPRIELG